MQENEPKLLVAGADGMIGQSLVADLSSRYSLTTTGFYTKEPEITYIGDLSQKEFTDDVAAMCNKPKVLVFLIGLAHKKGKDADYRLFEKVNFITLVNLIEALQEHNKLPEKIIFASSVSVYGERREIMVYNENTETQPFSPYAVTKLKAEKYLVENYPEISWVLRFAPVYSKDFMLNIVRRTKIGPFHYKVGNGKSQLSLCSLKNIHTAIERIISGGVPVGIYNLSDQNNYTYNDILKYVNTNLVFRVPIVLPQLAYYFGLFSNNIFVRENSLKLIKDNVFPSSKIRNHINLPYKLKDIGCCQEF